MGDWGLYIILLVPALLLGLGVQWWLKRTFARYSNVELLAGLTGAEVARQAHRRRASHTSRPRATAPSGMSTTT